MNSTKQIAFCILALLFWSSCMEQHNAPSSDQQPDLSSLDAGIDMPPDLKQTPPACDTDVKCPDDMYCVHGASPCEGPGLCQRAPATQSGDYSPVCGCDGLTYGNEDTAQSNGVTVAKRGVCQQVPSQSCGGMYEDRFGGFYCDFGDCIHDDGDLCGGFDASGSCEARPDTCNSASQPVCGCDNKTYINECQARLAGAGILNREACAN